MSLLFDVPTKIACEILLKWIKNFKVIDFLRNIVDQAVCNRTWRPIYIALLHNENFVVEEDIELLLELKLKRKNRRNLIYLELMRI